MKKFVKELFRYAGFKIEKRDPLEESIPAQYNHSPFLPRVYRGYIDRIMYFLDQLRDVDEVDGDIVECGVSIGHGALEFLLLSEYLGVERDYYGFDSFEGFPEPVAKDEQTPITGPGFWANPPETVLKVLREGRIPEEKIQKQVHLIKGYFNETLHKYDGKIALLHLDCDLYDSYKNSLETLYDRVSPGGVIMFDEYADDRWPGATKAIDEFFADKPETVKPHEKMGWKYYVKKAQ